MSKEFDVAQSMANEGSPEADRHLAENFGMTVRQVRDFDPQTLDSTRACKFLGLPPKRFDQLASQPEARGRWVESVARQKKDLIETFPQAGTELKGMLEAIRKFALRKCLKPDGPALVDGRSSQANGAFDRGGRPFLLIGGGVAVAVVLSAVTVYSTSRQSTPTAATSQQPSVNGSVAVTVPMPDTPTVPPVMDAPSPAGRVVYSYRFDQATRFAHQWRPKTRYERLRDALPAGLWAGCYDPKSAGAFTIEKVDGTLTFGLASRGAPATAQLSVDAEKLTGGLQDGKNYNVQFEYLTRGNPGAYVAWMDPKHNKLAGKSLPETSGKWLTASLAVTRTKTPLRVNIDSGEVTSDGMLYLRSLLITDDSP